VIKSERWFFTSRFSFALLNSFLDFTIEIYFELANAPIRSLLDLKLSSSGTQRKVIYGQNGVTFNGYAYNWYVLFTLSVLLQGYAYNWYVLFTLSVLLQGYAELMGQQTQDVKPYAMKKGKLPLSAHLLIYHVYI